MLRPMLKTLPRFSPVERDLGFATPMPILLLEKAKRCFSPVERDLGFATSEDTLLPAVNLCFSPVERDLGFATNPLDRPFGAILKFQSRRTGFGVCDSRGEIAKRKEVEFQSRRTGFGVCDDNGDYELPYSKRFQSRRTGFGVCDLPECETWEGEESSKGFSPVERDLGFATN